MLKYKKLLQKQTPPGGFEPPTFRLTAERANRLRHEGYNIIGAKRQYIQCI